LIAFGAAANSRVCPSGGALTTACVPMLPLAPTLFSMTNGCPSRADGLPDQPGDDVARTARGKRHDQMDQARWIALRICKTRQHRLSQHATGETENIAARRHHGFCTGDQRTRRNLATPDAPVDTVGFFQANSSPSSVKIRFCSAPSSFGYVLASIFMINVSLLIM